MVREGFAHKDATWLLYMYVYFHTSPENKQQLINLKVIRDRRTDLGYEYLSEGVREEVSNRDASKYTQAWVLPECIFSKISTQGISKHVFNLF